MGPSQEAGTLPHSHPRPGWGFVPAQRVGEQTEGSSEMDCDCLRRLEVTTLRKNQITSDRSGLEFMFRDQIGQVVLLLWAL